MKASPTIVTKDERAAFVRQLFKDMVIAGIVTLCLALYGLYPAWRGNFLPQGLIMTLVAMAGAYPLAAYEYTRLTAEMERKTGLPPEALTPPKTTRNRAYLLSFAVVLLIERVLEAFILPNHTHPAEHGTQVVVGYLIGGFFLPILLANRRFIRRLEADQGGNFIVNR